MRILKLTNMPSLIVLQLINSLAYAIKLVIRNINTQLSYVNISIGEWEEKFPPYPYHKICCTSLLLTCLIIFHASVWNIVECPIRRF